MEIMNKWRHLIWLSNPAVNLDLRRFVEIAGMIKKIEVNKISWMIKKLKWIRYLALDLFLRFSILYEILYDVGSFCFQHYERLNAHISSAGLLPPLLITGAPGSGRSLLLAKW
jgi:hypothetical protein